MAPPGTVLVTSWYICLVLAAPLIVLRLRSRLKRHEKLGVDDVVFIAAIFVVLGFNATIAYMWNLGLADWKAGYHISRAQVAAIMRMVLPSKLLYVSAAWTIKFSVVLFYRIVAPPGSRIVVMCYIVLGSLVVSWCGVFFYTLFGCIPWDKYWAGDLQSECPAEFTVLSWWLLTGLNVSTNLVVVLFPIIMVMKLDSRLRDKVAIIFMFILGLVVIAASCMQAYYNIRNEMMLTATASMVELSAGLIGTSLLALGKTILGKNAFQVSTSPRRSLGLTSSHHQAHLNEMKLLEEYKTEKKTNTKRSLSVKRSVSIKRSMSFKRSLSTSRANSKGTDASRMSTASKDSSVLPGQFHIGFTMEEVNEDEEMPEEKGIGSITVCAALDDLTQHRRSHMMEEVKSPGVESWFER
ncbi:hypothetical protein yc1106_09993 [Curvularia clavata]|uniref:Rhodopsin domain-containing protein n=1 Tax=Curvularia clavata TaxID=95742 RepID=A0A9Q9DY85_CURCL|nr:hypothetical protein yc1106_09993 [Curvularia clavata]